MVLPFRSLVRVTPRGKRQYCKVLRLLVGQDDIGTSQVLFPTFREEDRVLDPAQNSVSSRFHRVR